MHRYIEKIVSFFAKSLYFVILTNNDHTSFTSSSHYHNVVVIMWSNDHRHMCHVFGMEVKCVSKNIGIFVSLHSQNCSICGIYDRFCSFTNSSRFHDVFIIVWSHNHRQLRQLILGWKWKVLNKIMGALHLYTTKIARFVAISDEFTILMKIEHTLFTNSSDSHNVFVNLWSNDHGHMCHVFGIKVKCISWE